MDDNELTRLKKEQAYKSPILEHVLSHDSLDQEQRSKFQGAESKFLVKEDCTESAASSFDSEEEILEELCQPQQRTSFIQLQKQALAVSLGLDDLGLDDSFYAPAAAAANPTTRTRLTPSGANNNTNGADGSVAAQNTAASHIYPNLTAKRADADNANMNSKRVLLKRSHEVTPGAIQMTGRRIVGRGEVGRLTPHFSMTNEYCNSSKESSSTHDFDLPVQNAKEAITTGRQNRRIMIGIAVCVVGTALGAEFVRKSSQANEEIPTNLILAQLVFDCEAGSQ